MKGKLILPPSLTHESSLKTLVENRTIYNLNNCELNIFETYKISNRVSLKFNDFVLTSMLRGKKVMHLLDDPEFDYVPGESVIVPPNVEMQIDFPEADLLNPTQCLALEIDQAKIRQLLDLLNEKYPKEMTNWAIDLNDYCLLNNEEISTTLNKLMAVCMSSHLTKDILADLTLQELLIHLIQLQTVQSIESDRFLKNTNVIGLLVDYMRSNLEQKITMKELSARACMSNATLYRYVKRETGLSPLELLLRERIRYAKMLLKNPGILVNQVSFEAGFEDPNYFTRMFKKVEGLTPKQYQALNIKN